MDAVLKRMIAVGFVLTVLMCMITVSASPPGSTTDPLITRSHLEGAFATSLRSSIHNSLSGVVDTSIVRLNEIYKSHAGYTFAPRFTQIRIAAGEAIALSSGSSFVLLSGTATLTVANGTVINVSTGSEVASGAQLTQYQRYFCTENTSAIISASTASVGHVDGFYLADGVSAPTSHLPFTDVSPHNWFFVAVDFAFENNLFTGMTETLFSPNTSMTRAMFVTVLHRLDGLPTVVASDDFTDVRNPARYYYNAVAWASENEIVTGYADGTFRPDVAITREQMAAIMFRYAAYKENEMSALGTQFDTFPDRGAISEYAVEAMRWAVSWEVIRGSEGRLLPRSTATRAQVAQIIYNYCENIGR